MIDNQIMLLKLEKHTIIYQEIMDTVILSSYVLMLFKLVLLRL